MSFFFFEANQHKKQKNDKLVLKGHYQNKTTNLIIYGLFFRKQIGEK